MTRTHHRKSVIGIVLFLFSIQPSLSMKIDVQVNTLNLPNCSMPSGGGLSSKNKIRDRLKYLEELGCQLQFVKASNSIFENNLRIIDSLFPELYASMVQFYYSSADTSINTLTKHLATSNPLDCKTDKKFEFYAYKVKKILCDLALGMMPATEWLGQYDHTNGYLVVKKNGDVLSYHIFHRNLFEDYLFSQTKFDTPSVKRHKFGVVLKNNQVCKIILNAQIRFIQ